MPPCLKSFMWAPLEIFIMLGVIKLKKEKGELLLYLNFGLLYSY